MKRIPLRQETATIHMKNSLKLLLIFYFITLLKEKQIRGSHALFIAKKLSKAIVVKSKNIYYYLKVPSRENFVSLKNSKRKCNSSTKKAKEIFFKAATKDGIVSNKKNWSTAKLFLTNKGCISNDFHKCEKRY